MFFRDCNGIKNHENLLHKENLQKVVEKINNLQEQRKKVLIIGNLFKNVKVNLNEQFIDIPKIDNYLENILKKNGYNLENVKTQDQLQEYYEWVLPSAGIDFYTNMEEKEKFDAIFLEENEKIEQRWIICLNKMIKRNGKVIELEN